MSDIKKIKSIFNNYMYLLFFALVLSSILFVNNFYFLKSHNDLYPGDNLYHLMTVFDALKGQTEVYRSLRAPGVYLAIIFFNKLFSNPLTTMLFVQSLFYCICVYCSGVILLKLTRSLKSGLMALLLTGMYPIVFGLSRILLMELALTCAVILFTTLIIMSNDLKSVYYSMFAGIILGYGSLAKESYLIYVFPVVLWQLYNLIKNVKIDKERLWGLTVFILFFLLSSIWLYSDFKNIIHHGLDRIILDGNNRSITLLSFKNFLFYIYALSDFCLGWLFFLFFLIAVIRSKKDITRYEILFLFSIISSYVLFSFFPWKLSRYLAPVVPFMAILTVLGIYRMKYAGEIYRILVIYGLIQFFVLNYNLPFIREEYFIRTPFLAKCFKLTPKRYREDFWITAKKKKNLTGGKSVINFIKELESGNNNKVIIAHLINSKKLSINDKTVDPLSSSMECVNKIQKLDFLIINVIFDNKNIHFRTYAKRYPVLLNKFEYVVSYNDEIMITQKEFKLCKLLDDSQYGRKLFIYKRIK